MAWTGIATDLTLEGVIDTRADRAHAGPPPPVVGGPLPRKPWAFGRVMVFLALLALGGFVALLIASPGAHQAPDDTTQLAPKASPSQSSMWDDVPGAAPNKAVAAHPAKKGRSPTKSGQHGTQLPAPERAEPAAGADDISLEKFRELSGKI